jgi:hypothetical protein
LRNGEDGEEGAELIDQTQSCQSLYRSCAPDRALPPRVVFRQSSAETVRQQAD